MRNTFLILTTIILQVACGRGMPPMMAIQPQMLMQQVPPQQLTSALGQLVMDLLNYKLRWLSQVTGNNAVITTGYPFLTTLITSLTGHPSMSPQVPPVVGVPMGGQVVQGPVYPGQQVPYTPQFTVTYPQPPIAYSMPMPAVYPQQQIAYSPPYTQGNPQQVNYLQPDYSNYVVNGPGYQNDQNPHGQGIVSIPQNNLDPTAVSANEHNHNPSQASNSHVAKPSNQIYLQSNYPQGSSSETQEHVQVYSLDTDPDYYVHTRPSIPRPNWDEVNEADLDLSYLAIEPHLLPRPPHVQLGVFSPSTSQPSTTANKPINGASVGSKPPQNLQPTSNPVYPVDPLVQLLQQHSSTGMDHDDSLHKRPTIVRPNWGEVNEADLDLAYLEIEPHLVPRPPSVQQAELPSPITQAASQPFTAANKPHNGPLGAKPPHNVPPTSYPVHTAHPLVQPLQQHSSIETDDDNSIHKRPTIVRPNLDEVNEADLDLSYLEIEPHLLPKPPHVQSALVAQPSSQGGSQPSTAASQPSNVASLPLGPTPPQTVSQTFPPNVQATQPTQSGQSARPGQTTKPFPFQPVKPAQPIQSVSTVTPPTAIGYTFPQGVTQSAVPVQHIQTGQSAQQTQPAQSTPPIQSYQGGSLLPAQQPLEQTAAVIPPTSTAGYKYPQGVNQAAKPAQPSQPSRPVQPTQYIPPQPTVFRPVTPQSSTSSSQQPLNQFSPVTSQSSVASSQIPQKFDQPGASPPANQPQYSSQTPQSTNTPTQDTSFLSSMDALDDYKK